MHEKLFDWIITNIQTWCVSKLHGYLWPTPKPIIFLWRPLFKKFENETRLSSIGSQPKKLMVVVVIVIVVFAVVFVVVCCSAWLKLNPKTGLDHHPTTTPPHPTPPPHHHPGKSSKLNCRPVPVDSEPKVSQAFSFSHSWLRRHPQQVGN